MSLARLFFLRFPVLALLLALAGCASVDMPKTSSVPADMRKAGSIATWNDLDELTRLARIVKLFPATLKDRTGWAADLQAAYAALGLAYAAPTYCASIAVMEQETGFQVDPVIPGLPGIVHKELERRAGAYGIPVFLLNAALLKNSPNGRSYSERIAALKTERQISQLFEEMIAQLPFGETWLADKNPVHTAGPMQVSIAFAEQHAAQKPYPYASNRNIRDEVFSRRGGLYFGAAILLDYPAPYDDVIYRFADFNAGRYSSRNAAFQSALARFSGTALTLDGDLMRYEGGTPAPAPSSVESALLGISHRLGMSRSEIRRDLQLEKSSAFSNCPLYKKLFTLADGRAGETLPRQMMPSIDLKSPKITRKLTTEWFAKRVNTRFAKCLARDT